MTAVLATKVVDHGADLNHFVLVITGDGFTSADQGDFEAQVDALLAYIQGESPFDDASVWQDASSWRGSAHAALGRDQLERGARARIA